MHTYTNKYKVGSVGWSLSAIISYYWFKIHTFIHVHFLKFSQLSCFPIGAVLSLCHPSSQDSKPDCMSITHTYYFLSHVFKYINIKGHCRKQHQSIRNWSPHFDHV